MDYLPLAFTLILVGLVLMAAELVLYTQGVSAMLGLGGMIVGAVMLFGHDPFLGLGTFLVLIVGVPLFGRILLNIWPKTSVGRRLVLQPPTEQTTITPASGLDNLRGQYGKTLSALRPAGTVDFDGRRIDAMSEGEMIAAGQWVRCIDVQMNKVVVRIADEPPGPANLEQMEL